MAQTSYSRSFASAFAGMLSDANPVRVETALNSQGADIPAGVGVTVTAEGEVTLPADGSSVIGGIVVHSYARDPNDLEGSDAVKDGDALNLLVEGAIYVKVEEAVAVGDPVYCRHTTGDGDEPPGGWRMSADTSKAAQVLGARWLKGAGAGEIAELYFSAAANLAAQ